MNTCSQTQKTIIGQLHKKLCQRYNSGTAARVWLENLRTDHDFDLPGIYDQLVKALRDQGTKCVSSSAQNWRFEVQPTLAPTNKGEKVQEKMIAIKQPEGRLEWVNQVPVASGVFSSTADRKRAVDLVRRVRDGEYEFIELKTEIGTNNPVYAAQEILLYGIVYAFYRNCAIEQHSCNCNKPLLLAKSISLVVAAPTHYFEEYRKLDCFERLLSDQLGKWGATVISGMNMSFRFDSFEYCDSKETHNSNVVNFLKKTPLFSKSSK